MMYVLKTLVIKTLAACRHHFLFKDVLLEVDDPEGGKIVVTRIRGVLVTLSTLTGEYNLYKMIIYDQMKSLINGFLLAVVFWK